MNGEVLKQAMDLFDSYEKWDAFIELSNVRGEIKKRYFERLKSRINELSISNETIHWHLLLWTDQYRWFLSEFGQESICLIWDPSAIKLWCNPNNFDSYKIKELLTTEKYSPIKACFDFIDTQSYPNCHHFFEERHRFAFLDGLIYSSINMEDQDKLSWFAGNKTDEMANLIMSKVDKFRNPEITALFRELNKVCKK